MSSSLQKELADYRNYALGLLMAGNLYFGGRLVDKLDRTAKKVNDMKMEMIEAQGKMNVAQVEMTLEISSMKKDVGRINETLKDFARSRKSNLEDAAYSHENRVVPFPQSL